MLKKKKKALRELTARVSNEANGIGKSEGNRAKGAKASCEL